MAALIAAFLLAAAAQPASRPWICARNFTVGTSEGLAVQTIGPGDAVSGVDVQIWTRGARGARVYWDIPYGRGFARPRYFAWEMEIEPPAETLWKRYWGDGRYLGQELLVDAAWPRRTRRQRIWSVSTSSPEILAGLVSAERWEVEIVNANGASIARAPVPLPPPSALRPAIGSEVQWLESVIRTRAEPCYEEPDDSETI